MCFGPDKWAQEVILKQFENKPTGWSRKTEIVFTKRAPMVVVSKMDFGVLCD